LKPFVKWIGSFFLLLLLVALFLPKRELYYKGEELLYQRGIVISDEQVRERALALELLDGKLYLKGILIGDFNQIQIYPDILFNLVTIQGFKRNKSIALIPDIAIERLLLFYTPFYPIKVFLKGEGSFGRLDGWIDLVERRGEIDLFGNPKGLGSLLKLKKIEEGHYRYEFTL